MALLTLRSLYRSRPRTAAVRAQPVPAGRLRTQRLLEASGTVRSHPDTRSLALKAPRMVCFQESVPLTLNLRARWIPVALSLVPVPPHPHVPSPCALSKGKRSSWEAVTFSRAVSVFYF